jgi:signal transduction histidine kinase
LSRAIQDADESARRLTHIINNFLNITALKSGAHILSTSSISLKSVIRDVLQELKKEIEERNLVIDYPSDESAWPILTLDAEKIREVFLVILENAVRYNIPHGMVTIRTMHTERTFEVSVHNTGIPLTSEDSHKIFTENFYRSADARKAHPMGMGIGLSVARAIVIAHKGSIYIEPGEGGTRVRVTLPL